MDHVPTPSSSVPPIEIPFVADYPWDFLDFETFPRRQGFAVDDDDRLLLDVVNPGRLASLLQSWLYFGLLSDILGPRVCADDFRRERQAYSDMPLAVIVDSTILASLIQERTKELYKNRWLFRSGDWQSIFKRSKLTAKLSKRLEYTIKMCAQVSPHPMAAICPLTEIIYSIEVLCETLQYLFNDGKEFSWRVCVTPSLSLMRRLDITPTSLALIRRQMTSAGWCQSVVEKLSKEHNILTLQYISRMKPLTNIVLTLFAPPYNHVDMNMYNNRHVIESCVCELVHIKGDARCKLISIIKKGGVPLIRIKDAETAGMSLIVKEYTFGSSFVAISHVWSDGLRNPFANALPRCQLRKLAGYLENHPLDKHSTWPGREWTSPLWFWMDTLCIPPAKPTDPEYPLRLNCIDRMALIYASARRVLILDHSLRQTRLSTCSYTEILVQIYCCAWNQRSWTLQEGALAHKTSFQLADCSFDPFLSFFGLDSRSVSLSYFQKQKWIKRVVDVMTRFYIRRTSRDTQRDKYGIYCQRMLSRYIRDHMVESLREALQGIRRDAMPSEEDKGTYSFAHAWNNLRKRSTTKPEDTYVVLANLLGFIPNQIQRIQGKERLRAIIFNMNSVPQSLLYNTGKRICSRARGENWVPTELSREELYIFPTMKRTVRGFSITSGDKMDAGLILITPSICRDAGPVWLRCGFFEGTRGYQIMDIWIKIDIFRPSSHSEYDPAEFDSTCVLIEQHWLELLNPAPRVSWRAALFHASPAHHSSPNTSAERSNPGHTIPSPESFRVMYDCPARVSIIPEQKPQGEWDYNLNRPKKDNRGKGLRRFDPLKLQPWRIPHDDYQAKKLKMALPNSAQDDMLGDAARLIHNPNSPHAGVFGKKRGQTPELAFESTCSVRFPKSWELVLAVAKDKAIPHLKLRPLPVYNFMHQGGNPLFHAACMIAVIAPLACIILIALHAKELVLLSKEHWLWKTCLTLHVMYIVGYLGTITLSNDFIVMTIGMCYLLAFGLLPVIGVTFWISKGKAIAISNMEFDYVIAPCEGCVLLTTCWFHFCHKGLTTIGHRHWLSTFDSNWQDENTPWYWRPTTFWEFLKLVFGLKFLRLRRRQETVAV